MSAQPGPEHKPVPPPQRTPAAVARALPADQRERFLADYRAALEEAKTTLDLAKVNDLVEAAWRSAWWQRSPRYQHAAATGRRLLADQPADRP